MAHRIVVWTTKDGRLFREEKDAIAHEEKNAKWIDIELRFEEKLEDIKQYIASCYSELDMPEEIIPSYEEDGWECNDSDNPIGYCIYDWLNSNEDCVYCGNPEERK